MQCAGWGKKPNEVTGDRTLDVWAGKPRSMRVCLGAGRHWSRKLTNVQCSVVGLQKNLIPPLGVDIRGCGGLGTWGGRQGKGTRYLNKATAAGPPH